MCLSPRRLNLYCVFRSQKSERDEKKKHSEHRHRDRDKDKYKNKRTSVGIQCKREDVVPSSIGNFINLSLLIYLFPFSISHFYLTKKLTMFHALPAIFGIKSLFNSLSMYVSLYLMYLLVGCGKIHLWTLILPRLLVVSLRYVFRRPGGQGLIVINPLSGLGLPNWGGLQI